MSAEKQTGCGCGCLPPGKSGLKTPAPKDRKPDAD